MARTKKSVQDAQRARLMRQNKAELAQIVIDLGLEVMDLESQIEELQPADWMGEVEKSTIDFCRSVDEPTPHQLVVMAAATKLAQVLDEGGDLDKSAASTEKQLLETCAALAASVGANAQVAPLFALPSAG